MFNTLYLLICYKNSHLLSIFYFFFFNDTATTEIYTLSLHDALPISIRSSPSWSARRANCTTTSARRASGVRKHPNHSSRSEEHTSELQSRQYLVCRLLLEKKKKIVYITYYVLDRNITKIAKNNENIS